MAIHVGEKSFSEQVLELCRYARIHADISPYAARRDGSASKAQEILATINHLEQWLKERPLPYLGREAPRVGHRHYDGLIEDLFASTTTGRPREVFLHEVLDGLHQLGSESEEEAAEALLVLEGKRSRDGSAVYRGFAARGVQEDRWANYCRDILPKSANSRLLEQLLFGHHNLEVIHSFYLPDYAGEFDALVRRKRDFWINAIALPATASHYPSRTLIALYPARASVDGELRVPRSAVQEWRVLHFTAIAYQHLAHQLAGLAEQVAARRGQLLNELAPGILHHEMGACLNLMRANLNDQMKTVVQLLETYEAPELEQLREDNLALYDSAAQMYRVVDTFNNMEQRRGLEQVELAELITQLRTMCYHRLGAVGVKLDYQETASPLRLKTDAALLLHLMLNIVLNAINAFQESDLAVPVKTVSILAQTGETGTVCVDFFNNGPPIDTDIRARLFQRGVTSRPRGHGQGLYICRMITEYLSGHLTLLEDADLSPPWRVGFRLEMPLSLPDYRDLDSERHPR